MQSEANHNERTFLPALGKTDGLGFLDNRQALPELESQTTPSTMDQLPGIQARHRILAFHEEQQIGLCLDQFVQQAMRVAIVDPAVGGRIASEILSGSQFANGLIHEVLDAPFEPGSQLEAAHQTPSSETLELFASSLSQESVRERLMRAERVRFAYDCLKVADEVSEMPAVREAVTEAMDQFRAQMSILFEYNMRLIAGEAHKAMRDGYRLGLMDLIQEGSIGMIRGVEKWDYRRGLRLSTYATHWVRQAVGRGIGNQSRLIRLPVFQDEKFSRIHRTQRELAAQLQRTPSEREVAEAVEMPERDVRLLIEASVPPVSLSTPMDEHDATGSATLEGAIEDETIDLEEEANRMTIRDLVASRLDRLKPRYAEIVRRRFGIGQRPETMQEIGEDLNLSRERIRQIERAALERLRPSFEAVGFCEEEAA